ncbi:hypothetical protein A3Q56_07792 [Intoshia linei]|uniref:Uncharacterized protein n=1 Tax=Intoshia linei TaxID=1819745 RepID=A0A177AR77_9BILA|nr:hypothetical protein A3Q56_07792 [Intoshia linei]
MMMMKTPLVKFEFKIQNKLSLDDANQLKNVLNNDCQNIEYDGELNVTLETTKNYLDIEKLLSLHGFIAFIVGSGIGDFSLVSEFKKIVFGFITVIISSADPSVLIVDIHLESKKDSAKLSVEFCQYGNLLNPPTSCGKAIHLMNKKLEFNADSHGSFIKKLEIQINIKSLLGRSVVIYDTSHERYIAQII